MILDLSLPGIDGFQICEHLRLHYPNVLILMLTARSTPTERIAGLNSGADDYLTKPFHFGEVVARINALLRRRNPMRASLLKWSNLQLDPISRIVWRDNITLDLTRKEFSILEYLMYHPGEVVSQEALLEHVWDGDVNPFTNTVRTHVHSLRRKLGGDYIQTVVGQGYRLCDPTTQERAICHGEAVR